MPAERAIAMRLQGEINEQIKTSAASSASSSRARTQRWPHHRAWAQAAQETDSMARDGSGMWQAPELVTGREGLSAAMHLASCASCVEAAHTHSAPWIVKNPEELEGHTSLFNLDEWIRASSLGGAKRKVVVQCIFGTEHLKRAYLCDYVQISGAPWECSRVLQWRRPPPDGRWSRAKNPPPRRRSGRQRVVPAAPASS